MRTATTPMRNRPRRARKHETNPKYKCSNVRRENERVYQLRSFGHLDFRNWRIVSGFEFFQVLEVRVRRRSWRFCAVLMATTCATMSGMFLNLTSKTAWCPWPRCAWLLIAKQPGFSLLRWAAALQSTWIWWRNRWKSYVGNGRTTFRDYWI